MRAFLMRKRGLNMNRRKGAGRHGKREKVRTVTHNLTQGQLGAMIRQKISGEPNQIKQEVTEKAINTATALLLTLPLEVLMDFY